MLRIRRLVDLGVPPSDIPAMEESEENAEQTLRAPDAELKASIERQQRMRADLTLILQRRSLADLSEVERSLLMVYSRLVRRQFEEQPSLKAMATSEALTRPVVIQGLVELYGPAQLDVLRRLNLLLDESLPDP